MDSERGDYIGLNWNSGEEWRGLPETDVGPEPPSEQELAWEEEEDRWLPR